MTDVGKPGKRIIYTMQGKWDGVWWEIGRGVTPNIARSFGERKMATDKEIRDAPKRIVKVTTTVVAEVVEGEGAATAPVPDIGLMVDKVDK